MAASSGKSFVINLCDTFLLLNIFDLLLFMVKSTHKCEGWSRESYFC